MLYASPQHRARRVSGMIRSVATKVMWVGRATVFVAGLAVILAVIFSMASIAFARDGQSFILGERNVAQSVSTLVKQGAGPALDLQVGSGAPLSVNSANKVDNLNADQVDGKDQSAFASVSEFDAATVISRWSALPT